MSLDRLHDVSTPLAGFGLGLAAVGRPGYINLGRATDLPAERSVDALRARTHELLDAAYELGVRYLDTARSYGRAEEFLASWLDARPEAAAQVVVGSKWGYTYTADWQADASVHEVKDHGLATFERQVRETRALLGTRVDLYQIHSLTPDSPALRDRALHERLAALAAEGVGIGFSASGPRQADTIRAAMELTVDGEPLFRSVQATWNLLEPSAGPALAEAHAAGLTVVVKEAMANGRLAGRNAVGPDTAGLRAAAAELGAPADALALAAASAQPWVDVVLSGAADVAQLRSNLTAAQLFPPPDVLSGLGELAEPPEQYWAERSALVWA